MILSCRGVGLRKRFKILVVGAILALLLVGILPTAIQAAQTQISATGNISTISETMGFPTGNNGKYKVTSRTVTGSFVSGDLNGDYTFNYAGQFDLNTQAGKIKGNLTNGDQVFDIKGNSQPFSLLDNDLISTASGYWSSDHGYGTWTATYYLQLDADGHIIAILPDSSFTLTGVLNIN